MKKTLFIVQSPYSKKEWLVNSQNGSTYESGNKQTIIKFMKKYKNEYNFQLGGNLLK